MKSSFKHLVHHIGALGCILLSQNCSLYEPESTDGNGAFVTTADDGCDAGARPSTPPPSNAIWTFDAEGTNPFEPWGANSSLAANTGVNNSKSLRVGPALGGAGARIESRLQAGKRYHLEGQLKLDTTGGAVFGAKFINSTGGTISDRFVNVTSVNAYQKYDVEFDVPANTVTAYVYVWKNGASGYLYADNLVVTDAAAAATPPPSTPTPPPTTGGGGTNAPSGISPAFVYGVNIAAGNGAENILPGTLMGEVYLTPESHFAYYASKGFTAIRIQGLWERMQPTPFGALDGQLATFPANANDPLKSYAAHIKYYLDMAQKYGMKAWLDIAHNYGSRWVGYNGTWNNKTRVQIGSPSLPTSALADFNKKLVQQFGSHPALIGIELMNEPHDLAIGTDGWKNACQESINAIRSVNSSVAILIDGYSWASAASWPSSNPNLHTLTDPANKLVYSAHIYFDNSAAGFYGGSEATSPTHSNYDVGTQRIKPFIDWLAQHNLQGRGHIGEFGAPNTAPWAEILRRTIVSARGAGLMLTPHQDIPYPNDPYVMNLFPPTGQGDRYMVKLMQSAKDGTSYLKTPLVP